MDIGIYSFVETKIDPSTGRQLDAQERMAHLLEEIEVADRVGLDLFGVGEHHRPDYVSSTPATTSSPKVVPRSWWDAAPSPSRFLSSARTCRTTTSSFRRSSNCSFASGRRNGSHGRARIARPSTAASSCPRAFRSLRPALPGRRPASGLRRRDVARLHQLPRLPRRRPGRRRRARLPSLRRDHGPDRARAGLAPADTRPLRRGGPPLGRSLPRRAPGLHRQDSSSTRSSATTASWCSSP